MDSFIEQIGARNAQVAIKALVKSVVLIDPELNLFRVGVKFCVVGLKNTYRTSNFT